MTAPQGYGYGAAAAILDISESKLRYWSQVGFVGPSRRSGTRPLFTFQDLVSAKAAKELVDRGFSAADIRKALDTVRATLPAVDRPLERLRVAFDGHALVVIDNEAAFEVNGQRVFDFGLAELAARAFEVEPTPLQNETSSSTSPAQRTAYEWFLEGLRLEREGARDDEALACYGNAVRLDAGLAAAHTNVGAIAYRRGDLPTARASFEAALASDPDQPEARYDLAHVYFEEGAVELAAAELRQVVKLAPLFPDAHYNLATALERLGSKRQAREHLERYLALVSASHDDHTAWIDEARQRLSRL